ncbi:hypothetical protein [Hoeflea sp. TYP-13]|uniref:hypothetical protein n=1 Tax=Hoeflea sp. TYP-13 TaxID=3230023 RepID=UPI0034C6CF74
MPLLAGKTLLYVTGGDLPEGLIDIADWFGATLDVAASCDGLRTAPDCVLCPLHMLNGKDRAALRRRCKSAGTPLMALRSPSRACFRHAVMKFADGLSAGAT